MRLRSVCVGFAIALTLFGKGAWGFSDDALISVSANPELAPFAAKMQQILQSNGKACDGIVKLNATPQSGNALLVAAACTGGQKYEALLDGTSIQIKSVP